MDELQDREILPNPAFVSSGQADRAACEFAICWNVEGGEQVQESYVNLIPTAQGGTHVNGLRSGVTEALREFCELRNLLPRNLKLSAEDVWDGVNYILSLKFQEPQFSGQTKERLSSREASNIVLNIAKDAFSLWLNQHAEIAMQLAEMAISKAGRRLKAAKKVERKKLFPALHCRVSWQTVLAKHVRTVNYLLSRVTQQVVVPSKRAIKTFRRSCQFVEKS